MQVQTSSIRTNCWSQFISTWKRKTKRTEKSWKWRKATARKIGSKESPEAKAMIYICTRHSQMHRKRLNEHIREHNHWGCAQCVYGWSSCVQYGFYMLLIMQYSFTTWHIKLLLFYRMLAIKYWMAMHLAKNICAFRCWLRLNVFQNVSTLLRRKWIIDQREKFHFQPPICTKTFRHLRF